MTRIQIVERVVKRVLRSNHLRIFVLECPDPLDLLQGRSEGPALATIGRLIGHEVVTFTVRSKREFEETCRYVSSMDASEQQDRSLCLHISAHGNESGLGFGPDAVNWEALAETVGAFMERPTSNKEKRIIVLSACYAEKQQLSDRIKKLVQRGAIEFPPKYLFCSSGEVAWQDAAVGWTLFYHLLPEVDLDNRKAVQDVLNKIKAVGIGQFYYFRWDRRSLKYKRFAAT